MSINYRPEINGLRALAIIPVIFFHADFEIFRNGYLGVDIFFVISGYLITSLIIKDLVNDNFSIYFFLEKRARRILPNLYFILFVTLFFSWILLGRSELSSYLKSLAATILFLSNFFFWSEIPYFDSEANLKPLLHTWSLSIEGQFYIFFPFLLTLIYKLKKKILIHILVIIFFLSLLLCFLGLLNRVNANFYFTITRIWELLMGGIAAFLIIKKKFSFSERLDNIFSLFGLILIILSFFFNFYHDYVPAALFPAIGTAMIIIFSNKYTVVARLLSTKIFLQIGIISYSLYLWHYPILAFAKNYYHEINFNLKIFLIFLSFVLSIFTYKLIELPFRDNNFINKNKFLKLITFLSIFFFLISISTFYYFQHKGSSEVYMADFLKRNSAIFSSNINDRFFVKNRILFENYNPEILVVGSSRHMQLGENEFKKKTLNLSVVGASIEDQITITEMALEKFNPSTIYLGGDPWLFNKYNNQKRWKSIKTEYYKTLSNINSWNIEKKTNFYKQKLINDNNKILNITFSEYILEKVYIKFNINSNLITPTNIQPTQYKGLILRDGKRIYNLSYQRQIIKDEPINYSNMSNYEFSTIQYEIYENFINYLKNYHKKEVILILSPYHNPSFQLTLQRFPIYLKIEDKFKNLAVKHNIKIIGGYDPKLVNCKNNEFYDNMHPNDICMKKIIRK